MVLGWGIPALTKLFFMEGERMKAYKITLLVIDSDEIGADEIRNELENGRYGNDCISPDVMTIEERDIGEWSDDHPLNRRDTADAEFQRLFGSSLP